MVKTYKKNETFVLGDRNGIVKLSLASLMNATVLINDVDVISLYYPYNLCDFSSAYINTIKVISGKVYISFKEDKPKITTEPIGQRIQSKNFKVEVFDDEMYINDSFTIASDAEYVDELIEVLQKTRELMN